jgi:hypothetical protein
MSEDIPDETAAGAQRGGRTYLKVDIPSVGPIDKNYRGAAGSDQRRPNLNDETCRRIILRIKGQSAG